MTREALNHIRDLDENLADWERYGRRVNRAKFLADRDARHAWLHAALVSLQAAIDIANHWAAGLTPRRPESYRGIVELLEEAKAVPRGLAKDLKGLFSLRNLLIHKYQELDLSRLHAHLQRGAPPLRRFSALAKAQARKRRA